MDMDIRYVCCSRNVSCLDSRVIGIDAMGSFRDSTVVFPYAGRSAKVYMDSVKNGKVDAATAFRVGVRC
jgi:hypothetical protein